MPNEKDTSAKAEVAQDFDIFLADIFTPSGPPIVEQRQAVTNLLQEVPTQEAIKPKNPEEVVALVTEAYTAVTPEQFVASAEQQIENAPVIQNGGVREVVGGSIDRYCLVATGLSTTPERTDGTDSSMHYWKLRDSFEVPAKEALGRLESRLVSEVECAAIAGSRLRTLADMERSVDNFATVLTSRVPNLTALDVESLDTETKRSIVGIIRQQTVEDLATLAVKVLESGEPQSAGLMLALLPEIRDVSAVRSALQTLVSKYRQQPDARTNENSMYQRYDRTSKEVLGALKSCGLVIGNAVVWSYPTITGSAMSIEPDDRWDANLWIETELVEEAKNLEREIEERIDLADDNGDFARYARLRDPATLGLASNCSAGYRIGIAKREQLP